MQATLNAREADPHDTFVVEPDVVLAARADKPDPQWREPDLRALVSEISAGVAAHSTAPDVDTSFRSVAAENRRGRWLSRFAVAFLFALVSAVGAAGWQRYGDKAQAYVAMAAPSLGFSSPQAASAPASTPAAEPAADQPTAPAAVTPAADAAATSTPASPDQTQQIQSLTRDLAAMGRQIESLKAGIAELTAGQQQLAHDAKAAETKAAEAKAFEQSMRAKVSALAPRTPVTARKPKPYVPPVQAAAAPLLPPPGAPGSVPVQIAPAPPPPVSTAPEAELVPRPPMPVR